MINLNHSPSLAPYLLAGCYPLLILAGLLAMSVTRACGQSATNTPSAIPWNQIGAKAGVNYQGDGLAVTPTEFGAHLHCVFQRLDGEATSEGLWLTSTVTNTVSDRFRVTAMAVGRTVAAPEKQKAESRNLRLESGEGGSQVQLADTGKVSVDGQTVRWSRPGLTEEYSVSMDGVRQDFIVEQSPLSPLLGELVVQLAVAGAQVESAADGARLVMDHSRRKLTYSRLRVTDATGRELPARIEVASGGDEATSLDSWSMGENQELSLLTPGPAKDELAVVVNDAEAVYPVRIDPTFSDANWVSMGGIPGANGQVNAAAVDGSGNLYIGGSFTQVGATFANNIAQWNGSTWSALGSGVNDYVSALAVSGSTLYAGGNFSIAGGSQANCIAQWNGSTWSALGSGVSGGGRGGPTVNALTVSGTTLYAGGDFTMAGGSVATNIAQWNGSCWSALGLGMNEEVSALAMAGGTLYAGGSFTAAGGVSSIGIAQWNGTSWSALGSGLNNVVSALAVSGSTLYAGGAFTRAGDVAANYIAQWNGSSWSALGFGVGGYVNALAVSGGTLYAGGDFFYADYYSAANNIAQWNGTNWSALGSGIGSDFFNEDLGNVEALAVLGGTLYAGGGFSTAGVSMANNIAQWNGTSWSALGSALNGDVSALAVLGGTLYAGGGFGVEQWNGSSWSAIGSGLNGGVEALAVSGGTLYAGGWFTNAGGSAANYIAQWNGSSWSALGSGLSSYVYALAVSGSTLYAGGFFTTAGGRAANYVAQWNGTNWSALGSGISGAGYDNEGYYIHPWVYALATAGSTLYAGGFFTTAGGRAAVNIAQWNGSSWSALGSGLDGGDGYGPYVSALAVSGSTLYAGGDFGFSYIAQWDGSTWSGLGSGLNGEVLALAVSGGRLYAGGEFTTAGAIGSAYSAMAYLPDSLAIITTNAAFGFTNGVFGFGVSGPPSSSVVIQASTDLQTWIPLQTNLLGSGPLYFSDPQPPADFQRFYRAQLLP